jgi:hypothetical protein
MKIYYEMPPMLHKKNGEQRRIGVEIELSGVELAAIACQTHIAYGGRIKEISPYEFTLKGSTLGDFKIELDYVYLKKYARERYNSSDKKEAEIELGNIADADNLDIEAWAADALGLIAKNFIPFEIITPPLPMHKLNELDLLIARLREHGAKGTKHILFYAFGVHLNPELPDTDIATVLAYFRAFFCLRFWLEEKEELPISRRVTPFINRFPNDYIRQVMNIKYAPTMDEFIDDYLAANPTRNRALDLLPLLAWLNEKKVRQLLPDEKISPRPTFHYRLPNSDIDNPDWSLALCWNNWVMVERLAARPDKLTKMIEAYGRHMSFLGMNSKSWREQTKQCLQDLLSL